MSSNCTRSQLRRSCLVRYAVRFSFPPTTSPLLVLVVTAGDVTDHVHFPYGVFLDSPTVCPAKHFFSLLQERAVVVVRRRSRIAEAMRGSEHPASRERDRRWKCVLPPLRRLVPSAFPCGLPASAAPSDVRRVARGRITCLLCFLCSCSASVRRLPRARRRRAQPRVHPGRAVPPPHYSRPFFRRRRPNPSVVASSPPPPLHVG